MREFERVDLIKKVTEREIQFYHNDIKFYCTERIFNTEYDMCKWLDKYTTGKWGIEFLQLGFELEEDAIIFKLMHV